MALDKYLLDLLVCPDTKEKLALADTAQLGRLNQAIEEGSLKNKVGQPVRQALTAALVRVDGRVAYPVLDDIPVLLPDEAIPLDPA
jgi:uncharacterized protein YbaR (Trm112 family)